MPRQGPPHLLVTGRGRGPLGLGVNMGKPICITRGCNRPRHARGLCTTCYDRLWRSDGFQPLPSIEIHSLSEVDTAAATAVCTICGPVKIRVRTSRGTHECMTVVARYRARRSLGQGKLGTRGSVTPETRRRWKYKMTSEQYAAMVQAQDGRCAICLNTLALMVDHDHACCPGKKSCGQCIRGLLCDLCNRGLGMFRDDAAVLLRAIDYLRP